MLTRSPISPPTRNLTSTILAIGWGFFLMGCVIGNWSAVIPALAVYYDLNDAILGAVLVPAVVGAIIAAPIVSVVVVKYGSKVALASGCICLVSLTIVLGIPSNIGVLVTGVIFLGFGMGWCDTAANHQAVLCEKYTGKSKLGLFHALYSIGGLVGVLYSGIMLQFGFQPLYVFIYLAVATIVPTLVVAPWTFSQLEEKEIESHHLLARSEEECLARNSNRGLQLADSTGGINTVIPSGDRSGHDERDERRLVVTNTTMDGDVMGHQQQREVTRDEDIELSRRPSTHHHILDNETDTNAISPQHHLDISLAPTATTATDELPKEKIDYYRMGLMAMLGFLAYMGEGSVGDWSTVFLTLDLKAEPLIGTLGFAFFELVVAIGRLSLDWLVTWIDRKRLLQLAGLVAAIGLGIVSLAPSLSSSAIIPVAVFGFTVCGAGLSVVAPIVISFAGSTVKGIEPASAIAIVSSVAYVGVLVGPPVFGGIATGLSGLKWSLLLDGVLMLFITVLATKLPSKQQSILLTISSESEGQNASVDHVA